MYGASSKKLSTDEKLKGFLNKSENLDEDNVVMEMEYKEARDRIRTSSLYGAGAKYRAPKTKVCVYCLEILYRGRPIDHDCIMNYFIVPYHFHAHSPPLPL